MAAIYFFEPSSEASLVRYFEDTMAPALSLHGAELLGHFVTEPAENTYPRLPIRTGETVFVWFASFADEAAYSAYKEALKNDGQWNEVCAPELRKWVSRPEEVLELTPTNRSLLRHNPSAN